MAKGIKKLIPDLQENPILPYKFHTHHVQKFSLDPKLEVCGTCGEVWLGGIHIGWCNPQKCLVTKEQNDS